MARPHEPQASLIHGAAAARLLAPAQGALEPAVRAVLFGAARFSEHGRSLAQVQKVAAPGELRGSFFPRLEQNIQVLRDARQVLEEHAAKGHHLAPAAGWLIDNGHLLDGQLETVRKNLQRRYFQKLPRLRDPPLAGLPRVYELAWAWVAHSDSGLDEDLLQLFLGAYQSHRELTLAEVWAIPTTLRVVLIENLRRLAERAATTQAARDVAHRWVEHTPSPESAAQLANLGQALGARGVLEAFALQLHSRSEDAAPEALPALREWLAVHLPDPVGALQTQQQQAAEDHQSVRNAVTSLRGLDRVDWREVLLRSSAALAALQQLPVFVAESEATQDLTLHDIEKLARRAAVPESQVSAALAQLVINASNAAGGRAGGTAGGTVANTAASTVVNTAVNTSVNTAASTATGASTSTAAGTAASHAASDADTRAVTPVAARAAVGSAGSAPQYWLRGPGRLALLQALKLPTRRARWQPWLQQLATPAYLLTLALGTLAVVSTFMHLAAAPGLPLWAGALSVLLLVWPASEAVLAVLHRLISESLPPHRLPRLALDAGIPPERRVLVVVPAMLTSVPTARALAMQLEQHHLANPERHAQFALLTDFADAPQQQRATDAALLLAARQAVEALNSRYPLPDGAAQRFLLLHRERRYSTSEQCWMGWERKRGKLEQLLAWLVAGSPETSTPFLALGTLSAPASGVCSVMTLDSDTDMPPGRLRELVAVAAHPLNLPVLTLDRRDVRRVIAGYAILQPRVVAPLPRASTNTAFHWLFSGQSGVDAYSAASSEVYQDLFAEGTFTGKGLLDAAAVHAVLGGRLPDAQVLSHDLLEGALTRCATLSDVTLVEDSPTHPDVAASRLHRWTRGDWQLLPFLLHPTRWPMAGINRWKLLDNLRRSLVAPASLALLVWAIVSEALGVGAALWLVAAAYGAGPLLGAVAALAPPRDDIALPLFFRRAVPDVLRALAGAGWHLLQLMDHALRSLDAVVRALARQFSSHRLLLQWTTAAAAQAAARGELRALVRRHRRSLVAAGVLLLALLAWQAWRPPSPEFAYWPWLLCAVWAATPLWTWAAAWRWPRPTERLDTGSHDHLRGVAQDTWRFYERYVTAADHHLPPDNVQFSEASPMVAHRTSPTNIGLYLLATATARELGFISEEALVERLESTLATLQTLPKWRGHCFNWYDTQTLAVLPPAYVSTVDSGNLSGHLLVVAAACRQFAAPPAGAATESAFRARLLQLAEQAQTLALQADFSVLYDPRRRLLHIGRDTDSDRNDAAHYDLLASEARLASLVAIAKGDVPPRHWSALGRPLFGASERIAGGWGRAVGLKSWSGSMFEYLMPSLVLEEPEGSLLAAATRTAVALQRADGQARGAPWGSSESAIAAQDHTLAYQYGPQGLASLALRRTPGDERVIAPYATLMALVVAPQAAVDNLLALEALGARHQFGFIEALDYTPHRQPTGTKEDHTPVLTFMAHHQAMGLLGCAHVLTGGQVQRWAQASPQLRAVLPLLQERAPYVAPRLRVLPPVPAQRALASQRWRLDTVPRRSALQPTQLLGNGRYAVVLRAGGAGYSQWQGQGLSRWRDDALRNAHGLFGYVSRSRSGPWEPLSASPGSEAGDNAAYETECHPDRVLLQARFGDLTACTTVSVSTVDDCELRQVQLHNPGRRPLLVRVAMALEPTLAPQRADEAHAAFSNLFLQARWEPADRAMFLQRRTRLPDEAAVHAVHFLATCDDPQARVSACADRALWLGRLGSAGEPLTADWPEPVSGDMATGLDPMSVISVELTIPPRSSRCLVFVLGAAHDEAALHALVDRWQQPDSAQRAHSLSDTLARIRLRELRLDPETWAAWLHLNTLLVSSVTRPLPVPGVDHVDRRVLWRHGIGGDRPILALWIEGAEGLDLARQLVTMLALWSAAGVPVDLVVVNAEPASYDAPVRRAFIALQEQAAQRADAALPAERRATLKLLGASDLSAPEQTTLRQLARVLMLADGRSLAQQIDRVRSVHEEEAAVRRRTPCYPLLVPQGTGVATAPTGRFSPEDASFRFTVTPTQPTPRPWANVLANPDFGCLVTEAGGGSTWAGNSRLQQLTAGSNDALCDPPCEALWLHDLDSERVWWLGRDSAEREVTHSIGATRMVQLLDGLAVELEWCVDEKACIKQLRVKVSLQPAAVSQLRRLRLVGFAEWTLGAGRNDRATVVTRPYRWLSPAPQLAGEQGIGMAVLATQVDASAGHGGATAFLCWRVGGDAAPSLLPGKTPNTRAAAWLELDDWTSDRREFHDGGGRWVLPGQLGARSGAGLDACAAVGCRLDVQAGQPAQATLLLGHADTTEAAGRLAQEACAVLPQARLTQQLAQWPALLDSITVRSPDAAFDAMVNRWLPYQAIACRLWARAGFYQAGGAFGFRDQLQDAMNLALRAPQLLLQQLPVHAARQFIEGDVQHWWHPPAGAGVRTHISDDLLWLPLALAHAVQHVDALQAQALLDMPIPFLQGGAIPPGSEDLYETPLVSSEVGSLFEHGARALDRSLSTLNQGVHGLPLMGSGDWNDGMNRVGHEGRGESVWLAWLLCSVIDCYAPLAEARGATETARAAAWREKRNDLVRAVDAAGWDGAWYRRAYFDDGSPLGSSVNAECRIDLIAQAWAVLSGAGKPDHAQAAMAAVREHLWDDAAGVMRLLDPPLAQAVPNAGYIQAYPPGIRENGGQYNHAAVWALMAFAQQGDAAWAWRVFEALSPAHRSAHPTRGPAYRLEPFVMAGDIYSQRPYAGRGGWSWYTGAASWLQRAGLESICGLHLRAGVLRLEPCLPPHWPRVELRLQHGPHRHRVVLVRGAAPALAGVVRQVQRGELIDLSTLVGDTTMLLVLDDPDPMAREAATTPSSTTALSPTRGKADGADAQARAESDVG